MNILFSLLFFFAYSYAFNLQTANSSVWLSGAAYCGVDKYDQMVLTGPCTGFIVKKKMSDTKTDLQGFIGVLPSDNTIYVVFRGSDSARNWIYDAEFIQVDYPACRDCSVHDGFYKSMMSLRDETVNTVSWLRMQDSYKSFRIVVTGHSYGAAVCQLMALELEKENIKVQVYNFGQPRIGNDQYAKFANSKLLSLWRFTHYKDIVPHVPPIKGMDYIHSCQEIYENEKGLLRECSTTNCEDPSCSDQFSLYQTNTKDHSIYLGHILDCRESTREI